MSTLEVIRDARELPHSLIHAKELSVPRGTWVVGYVAALLAVVTAIQCHIVTGHSGELSHWIPSLLYGSLLWFWWAAIAIGLWTAGQSWPRIWVMSWRNALLQLAFGFVVATAHLTFLQVAIHFMILRWPYLGPIGYETLVSFTAEHLSLEVLLYVIAWAACAAIHTQIARQEETVQSALLKQQLSTAHLRALQMQMEPHFLLNTLNAITALVEDGSQREAARTLSHLNEILKATLVRESPEKVSLAQELSLVEHYLAIEQIRFADRLRIEMSVDPAALDSKIPCFLLQPLVENAIRHGIAPMEGEGIVSTSVMRKGNFLHLSVRDNGKGTQGSPNKGHGIGLRNTEDRLEYFYPKNHEFLWGQGNGGGFEVSITIPYERV
jgi:sensor histidine kinase YesM